MIQGLIIAVLTVIVVYTYPWKKHRKVNRFVRRKSNPDVHVPRETLWERANRVYPRAK